MPNASLWIAAYDIADPDRLRTVASLCEDYGRRLQQSVFLCACSVDQVIDLKEAVQDQIERAADHFLLLPLCEHCRDELRQFGLEKSLPGSSEPLVI
jgi:CRISPR-associated protein Cas2